MSIHRLVVALVVAGCSAAFLMAAEIHPTDPDALSVHEWGTFTSVAGEDGLAVDWDALGCESDLPRFVDDFGYRGLKWRLRGTVRMETPVMYFYSSREVEAHVQVAFPGGVITEWYPHANYEVYQTRANGSVRRLAANLNGIDTSLRSLTGAIEWTQVKLEPDAAPPLPVENGASRYYAARQTDAAPLAVGGQHEKFLFYRGVGRFPVPLSARLAAGGKVQLENRVPDAVPVVVLFENRGGRLGYRLAGALENAVTLDPPSLDGALPQLRSELERALVEQGLFPKEAHAMLETWQDSWFEEGARVIYIVPSRSVDAILPLRIEPAPSQIARVFVGRIELLTSETTRSVEEALASSNWSTIGRYGRFLEPILNRIEAEDPEGANQVAWFRRNTEGAIKAGRCR